MCVDTLRKGKNCDNNNNNNNNNALLSLYFTGTLNSVAHSCNMKGNSGSEM
jgi:hypothetical protein